ncbi:MAG: hypothetical protein Q7T60_16220 [Sphingopyxis sp.]|nr:hypothetical protein [Sphingopyxis sp.]
MIDAAYGIGAYSPAEAGKLLGVPSSSIRRWLFGYSYDHHGPRVQQRPLWVSQYSLDQDEPLLGFRDLIEARMVAKLRNIGFGLPTIRICLSTAAEIAGDSHPFSSARFRTDGQRLFLERLDDDGAHDVIDLKSRQHAFPKIIERSFLDLDFDDEKATRWFPFEKSREVVADPERSFGQPITDQGGVPTVRLAQAYQAEGRSIEKVAKIFELATSVVRDALAFERQIGRLAVA